MDATLFDDSKYIVKPRSTDGTFCTTRTKKTIDRLRTCIVGEVRRNKCAAKLIREQSEEIIRLKKIINNFAIQDALSNLF